jgi:hypothetical protein
MQDFLSLKVDDSIELCLWIMFTPWQINSIAWTRETACSATGLIGRLQIVCGMTWWQREREWHRRITRDDEDDWEMKRTWWERSHMTRVLVYSTVSLLELSIFFPLVLHGHQRLSDSEERKRGLCSFPFSLSLNKPWSSWLGLQWLEWRETDCRCCSSLLNPFVAVDFLFFNLSPLFLSPLEVDPKFG